ncbi:hypothetical protein WNZ15_15170 [Roseibium sp. AS2]|uniref:hypothetical protein n=2 Tax=unclassified Roseibium TaxID=2629323 RepID=UPI00316E4675
MVSFALKGAVIDYAQLEGRARFLAREKLPLRLELHTFGPRDLYDSAGREKCLANLNRLQQTFGRAELTVHIPFQDVNLVTRAAFDHDQVAVTLEFADRCGAKKIVMHRYWGMVFGDAPARSNRVEAAEGFNAAVRSLARQAPGITLLVENMGFYFLASCKRGDYLAGPIDHFFPWEVAAFRADMAANAIANVEPFIDVAHATLSCNLFNRLKADVSDLDTDPRFTGITQDDLDRANRLHPFDFLDASMPWLHISDSHLLAAPFPQDLPQVSLTSEGLELGTGNLPFQSLPEQLANGSAPTTLLLEVDPGKGDNYADNYAQCRSLKYLRQCFDAEMTDASAGRN